MKQFATDEKKLTKQIKEHQENEMKLCAMKQKTAYKNNKTKFKKVSTYDETILASARKTIALSQPARRLYHPVLGMN